MAQSSNTIRIERECGAAPDVVWRLWAAPDGIAMDVERMHDDVWTRAAGRRPAERTRQPRRRHGMTL